MPTLVDKVELPRRGHISGRGHAAQLRHHANWLGGLHLLVDTADAKRLRLYTAVAGILVTVDSYRSSLFWQPGNKAYRFNA